MQEDNSWILRRVCMPQSPLFRIGCMTLIRFLHHENWPNLECQPNKLPENLIPENPQVASWREGGVVVAHSVTLEPSISCMETPHLRGYINSSENIVCSHKRCSEYSNE